MSTPNKHKLFFADIFSYFLVGISLCFIALFFVTYYSYQMIYQTAVDESSAAIKGAITTEQRKMSGIAQSYGLWNQTYDNTIIKFDKSWIETNIVTDIKRDFSIPYAAIYANDADFTTLYSNTDKFGTGAKPSPSIINQVITKFNTEIGRIRAQTQFVKDDSGQIFMISLSKVSQTDRVTPKAFLVLIKPITQDFVDQLSQDYALSNVDLVTNPDQFEEGSNPSLVMQQGNKILGYLTWHPRDSALNILKVLIPTGLIIIFLLTGIGFIITRKIVKANSGYSDMLEELAASATELMEAKEKSDQSSDAKTRFLSMMSHEIKTPMNGLMGMIALLKDTELNEAQIEYINTMENSTDSLLKLVDNILEFSKLESGEASVMFSKIDIRRMVAEIHGLLLPISIQKKLKFETNFDETVPLIIRSDAIRMRQILLHLVTNALKFTKVGSVRINVTGVDLGNNRCELGIQVIDTGIGIPEGIKETLFQDFFQIDGQVNRSHDGAGLGLSIVQNIATLLGAKVGIESKLAQGSVFWVQLDVDVVSKVNSQPNKAEPVTASNKTFNLLLIEEDAPDGSYTRNLLEKIGNQVETAANAAVAADMMMTSNYDAILIKIPENESLNSDFSPQLVKAAMNGNGRLPVLGIAKTGDVGFDPSQYDLIINTPLTSSKLSAALTEAFEGDMKGR